MSFYTREQVQIFKDGVEIRRFENKDLENVKFYSNDDIVRYAEQLLIEELLYNEVGIFLIDIVFFTASNSTLSVQGEIEQAHVVHTITSTLQEITYA